MCSKSIKMRAPEIVWVFDWCSCSFFILDLHLRRVFRPELEGQQTQAAWQHDIRIQVKQPIQELARFRLESLAKVWLHLQKGPLSSLKLTHPKGLPRRATTRRSPTRRQHYHWFFTPCQSLSRVLWVSEASRTFIVECHLYPIRKLLAI